MKFPENLSFGQTGNFGLILAQNYASLYLRICYKDFFQTLLHDRAQEADEVHLSKTSKESFFGLESSLWKALCPSF